MIPERKTLRCFSQKHPAMNPLDSFSTTGAHVLHARAYDGLHLFAPDIRQREAVAQAYLKRRRPLRQRIGRILIGARI